MNRAFLGVLFLALAAFASNASAQSSAYQSDLERKDELTRENSDEVENAQANCTRRLKDEILEKSPEKSKREATFEAFDRCKKITGWK